MKLKYGVCVKILRQKLKSIRRYQSLKAIFHLFSTSKYAFLPFLLIQQKIIGFLMIFFVKLANIVGTSRFQRLFEISTFRLFRLSYANCWAPKIPVPL